MAKSTKKKKTKKAAAAKKSTKSRTAKPTVQARAKKPAGRAQVKKPQRGSSARPKKQAGLASAKAEKPERSKRLKPADGDKKPTKKKKSKKSLDGTRSSAEGSRHADKSSEHKDEGRSSSKRKLGLRGAAPWAARHAAKHAAEARARAAEPAPPGSARATIRVPSGAEEIKAKIAELHNQTQKIRTLRKRLDKGFFDIGLVLLEIQNQELYLAKGFGSFEAFLEREIDLGKQTALKLMKLSQIFQRDAAIEFGMEKVFSALGALEGEGPAPKPAVPSSPGFVAPLPLKPPMRIVG